MFSSFCYIFKDHLLSILLKPLQVEHKTDMTLDSQTSGIYKPECVNQSGLDANVKR